MWHVGQSGEGWGEKGAIVPYPRPASLVPIYGSLASPYNIDKQGRIDLHVCNAM